MEPDAEPRGRPTPPQAHDGPIETDAVIVGAGPVGLFQVFELGLLEIKAHIIDSLAYPGGQCIELYPDKPIYDIPAVPVCTGKELTDNLLKQIEPFGATFHLGQEVTRRAASRTTAASSSRPRKGTRFLTKTIFIAGGVGSFQPRTLKVDGIERFDGTQLFYRVRNPAQFAGKNLVIVGGGDSALDWTLNFVQEGPNKAESVILLHRRDGFKAAPASVAKMRELCDAYEMQFMVGQVTGIRGSGRPPDAPSRSPAATASRASCRWTCCWCSSASAPSSARSPNGAWRWSASRSSSTPRSSRPACPGIFAVGDVNTYPGKKKLILSGFHEAALAAFGAAPYRLPGQARAAAVHHHQPEAAQGAGRGDAGVRLKRRSSPVAKGARVAGPGVFCAL